MAVLFALLDWLDGTPTPAEDPFPEPDTLGLADEDYIVLGGQPFAVKGFTRGNAVSEFETGIKVGPATYDQREHAFYLVLDDFSGGMGSRRLDIREELGTFWDMSAENAPDLRRPGHITLPMPKSTATTSSNPNSNDMTFHTPSYPWVRRPDPTGASTRRWLLGFGNSIYRTEDGVDFQRAGSQAGATSTTSVVAYNAWTGSAFEEIYFAFQTDGRYQTSLGGGAGGTWADGVAEHELTDGIVWDKKLLAVKDYNSIIFAVLNEFGEEVWNIDDPNDGEPITEVVGGPLNFIGTAEAPWGDQAVYFRDHTRIYVLDFFNRSHSLINIGVERPIKSATMWNGEIVFTDGWNVYAYSPPSQTVRNIGFPRKNGIPPSLVAQDTDTYLITYLLPVDDYLYATVADSVANVTRLFCYNNLGWSQIGEDMPFYSQLLALGFYPADGPVTSRLIHVVGADTTTSTSIRIHNFSIPNLHHVPIVGRDSFGESGAYWITGWIDGGFADVDGTLLRLNIDGFNLTSTEKVRVEYQLDNDESSDWTQMVDSDNVAADFEAISDVLYFSQARPKRGVEFRTVRFRITLLRGSDDTLSPELRALTLVYLKQPDLRTAWTFQLDVNRMIEKSATGNDESYYIDGQPATMARIWSKLRSLWNTKTLLPLIIPSIEPSPGIDVKLTDIPMTFDDWRDAVTGLGVVDIQVLEPVAR